MSGWQVVTGEATPVPAPHQDREELLGELREAADMLTSRTKECGEVLGALRSERGGIKPVSQTAVFESAVREAITSLSSGSTGKH
eukprot:CAMPEP_0169485196 /NCGR_PEP_ID=MMETSP1042-20121227/32168_1 /TAXON_ID=464988 /ORGANISM="Hemiselmis andersenii, Strain CCMP1180" /LENGTH=84 /DNA_ID=CAMNT_0009600291 /DNA_START=21 /DNA_END=275 /DNA_ORIENTATION=+